MNINNILEQVFNTELKNKKWRGLFDPHENPNPDKDELGRGYFSKVTKRKDPHIVKKQSLSPYKAQIDGYWEYINKVINEKLWEKNPYFPRVYKKSEIADKMDYTMKSIELEKLFTLSSLSFASLEALIKKMFGKDTFIDLHVTTEYSKMSNEIKEYMKMRLIRDIATALQNHASGSNFELRILLRVNPQNWDKNLLEAIQVLKSMKGRIDIYSPQGTDNKENVMIRKGPYGAQLVFTDPISI